MSPALALLALAAQAAEPDFYRALGAEPLWGARIGGGRMVFETPGREILNVEAPPRQETELGFAYRSDEFSLSIEHAECTDALTGRTFADRVTVRVGEERFEGCGGESRSAWIPAPYSAAGGEPFWWLEIRDGRLTWQIDNRVILVPLPAPRSTRNGSRRVYEAAGVSVLLRRENCELDDERVYADAVTVTAGGRTVHGCGGRVVREAPE